MSAQEVVLLSVPEDPAEAARRSAAHRAVMEAGSLGERAGLPPLHPRCGHRHPVDATTLHGDVSADLGEAIATKELAGTGDVLDVREPVVVVGAAFDKRRSGHAQARVVCELLHQESKVVGPEGNIRVEVTDHVERHVVELRQASVETVDLRSERPIAAFRHPDQADPWVLPLKAGDDLVGSIGRTVADDHPTLRKQRLGDHGLQREADELRLVTRRRHQHVARQRAATVRRRSAGRHAAD